MAPTATKEGTEQLADAIKRELRPIISRWSQANPERIALSIPVSSFKSLSRHDEATRINTLGQLEGYVGAALPASDPLQPVDRPQPTPINSPYELHPLPVSGVVQVLLRTEGLAQLPIRRLADEVACQAHNYAQKFIVNEVFRFTLMSCIIDRVEKMSKLHRANFRATLNRRLAAQGLWAAGGTIYSGLEIQRNR